jgi:hypothetical protein
MKDSNNKAVMLSTAEGYERLADVIENLAITAEMKLLLEAAAAPACIANRRRCVSTRPATKRSSIGTRSCTVASKPHV